MDKTLAKKADEILFVKVSNDGFDLGAQRRPIDKNDLPYALEIVKAWKQAIAEGNGFELDEDGRTIAHAVSKKKITESGDWNLSGDRYKEVIDYTNVKWSKVALGEVLRKVKYPQKVKKGDFLSAGKYPIVDQSEQYIAGYWNDENCLYVVHRPVIIFGDHTRVFKYVDFDFVLGADGVKVLSPHDNIDPKFLYFLLNSTEIENLGYSRHYKELVRKRIPLPPLEVQEKIVAELDGYQKIIDGAKQVVENYKPAIKIDPDWPLVELNSICNVRDGTHDSPKYQKTGVPLVTSKNVREGKIDFTTVNLISKEDLSKINKRSRVDDGDIIMPMIGTIGNPIIVMKDREFAIKNVALIKFHKNSRINRIYLKSILESNLFSGHYLNRSNGSTQKFISLKFIRGLPIPLPPLKIQQKIVADIESERELVEGNKKLIEIFEKKIKDKIGEVWGE